MAKRLVEKTKAQGIYRVHTRGCDGTRCRCAPMFEATVYVQRDRKLIRKRFAAQREAEVWRGELRGAVGRGEARAPTRKTINRAADQLIAGMKAGTIMNRSGRVYKPSVVRGYDCSLRLHIRPEIGTMTLQHVNRERVKKLVQKWVGDGQAPSTVRNNLDPLRVIFREALEDAQITIDPTVGFRVRTEAGGASVSRIGPRRSS